jgi:hypothetical protein
MNRKHLAVLFLPSLVYWQAALAADSLSANDRDRAVKYLESTKQKLTETTKGLSQAEWNYKPGPDRWSVAEVLEHVAATQDALYDRVTNKVMKAGPREKAEDVKALDQWVLTSIPDRTKKVKTREEMNPTNRYGSPQASLKHFIESRDRIIAYVKKTPGLREHVDTGPFGKELDAYQWILYAAAHGDRHTKQMEEVKADANFPKA